MIKVNGLSKYYAGFAAVEGVSFTIQPGEIVGLLGLNGAGKSTILKVLGCFLQPSSGSVEISGIDTAEAPDEIRKVIGYLPDTPPLYNEMTVRSYLVYVAKLKDVAASDVESFVVEAAQKTNIQDVIDVRLGELSHGYRQRVGIAQAIVHKPKVLFLDEPINGLDPVQIVEMRDLITSLKGEHTVILSSHILSEITKTCDRIIIIDKGKVVAEGDEEALMSGKKNRMTVQVEARNISSKVIDGFKSIDGVESITQGKGEADDITALKFQCDQDARSSIAKELVNQGADLLEMKKLDDGLEGIFVQLVQNNKSRREEVADV